MSFSQQLAYHRTSSEPLQPVSQKGRRRVPSIDVLRGFVMVLIALDHTRDFFSAQIISVADPSRLTLPYFFTRWITHLCAPTFVFLSGLSVYLQASSGKSRAELSKLLLVRGCWLIILQFTVVYFVLIGPPGVGILQIIGAIGLSMLVLAVMVWLPLPSITAIGIAVVAGHNVFDTVHAEHLGHWSALWKIAHERGFISFHGRLLLSVVYPFAPWSGLMLLGYSFGQLWILPLRDRTRMTAWLGFSSIALFIVLRALHSYGDPNTWINYGPTERTVTSFLNVEKYPPSLQYVAITIGIVLLLLGWIDASLSTGRAPWLRTTLEVYGRAPLAYYIAHLALIHLLAIVTCAMTGHDWHRFATPLPYGSFIAGPPKGYGFSLPGVYVIWVVIILALYLPVKWYADYKRVHPEQWWLRYL
ncbi:DUF1624 domain-containing protein [Acidisarcina polymorpha]|nr:heparan-alpha-glucosaminide N-acetyltransferase domain-containing protein [Acidisarcina polymorpha]